MEMVYLTLPRHGRLAISAVGDRAWEKKFQMAVRRHEICW